jgi:hypothetical protein
MVNNRKAVKRKASAMATGQDMVAQGEGKTKRTPRSVGDEAANQAKYEVEAIVGKGLLKGGKVGYCVKWKGWDEKSNTYEPLSHLAEVTCLIKAFEKKEKERLKKLDEELKKREEEKQPRILQKAQDAEKEAEARELQKINDEKRVVVKASKRSSPVWKYFVDSDVQGNPEPIMPQPIVPRSQLL